MTPVNPDIKLSILILTVPSRKWSYFPTLLGELERSTAGKPVEILGLYDNKQRSVGAKRNALLQMAQGEWLAFIDDDDVISLDYIDRLLEAIDAAAKEAEDAASRGNLLWEQPLVILFDHTVSVNGASPKLCKYGVEFAYVETEKLWTGKPSHTQCWRTAYARAFSFPDENFAEDVDWVKQACAKLTHSHQRRIIGPPLYHYIYRKDVSETREGQLQPGDTIEVKL